MTRPAITQGFLILALILGASLPLAAQKKKYKGIRWVPSYKAALKEGKDRGCAILVVLTNKSAHENTTKSILGDKGVIQATKNLVCVVGHDGYDHTPKPKKKGARREDATCPIYNIRCGDHVKASTEINARFVRRTVVQTIDIPQHIYVDPMNDEELFRRLGGLTRKEMLYDISRAQKLVGRGMSRKRAKPIRAKIEEALRLIQRSQYSRAARLLDQFLSFKKKNKKVRSALIKDGDNLVLELESRGSNMIREALALEKDGNDEKAKHLLERVYKEFRPFEISEKARNELSALRKRIASKGK